MTTIVIKSKSKAAIQMINFLKTQPYALVIDTDEPNAKTAKAIQNVIEGKNLSKSYKSADEFFKAHNIWHMEIISEKQFDIDLKTCMSRAYNIELLKKVVRILETKGELPKTYKPHHLKGTKYLNKSIIDAHIENDWIILYRIKGNRVYLIRTGTHAELFK